jgi:addiction module HigA family antidote
MSKKQKRLAPIHPGEILQEDFLAPLGLSMNKLSLDLRVPVTRIAEFVHERRGITPDTALRLARYFQYQRPLLAKLTGSLRSRGSRRRAGPID